MWLVGTSPVAAWSRHEVKAGLGQDVEAESSQDRSRPARAARWSRSGVDQQADQGGATALDELGALACSQRREQLLSDGNQDGLVKDVRRLHPVDGL